MQSRLHVDGQASLKLETGISFCFRVANSWLSHKTVSVHEAYFAFQTVFTARGINQDWWRLQCKQYIVFGLFSLLLAFWKPIKEKPHKLNINIQMRFALLGTTWEDSLLAAYGLGISCEYKCLSFIISYGEHPDRMMERWQTQHMFCFRSFYTHRFSL